MDAELLQACELTWSSACTVTSAEGACERVLGQPAPELIGRPLHEVLGIAEQRAVMLDVRARQEKQITEFVPARPGDGTRPGP